MSVIGDWMATATGKELWLYEPQPELIKLEEVAACLARVPRFGAHTRIDLPGYSVAQHSVLVSRLCPSLPLAALLHDAHEAYIGDITTPLKRTFAALMDSGRAPARGPQRNPFVLALRRLTRGFDEAIAAALGNGEISEASFHHPEVKRADLVALATERRDLMVDQKAPWSCLLGIDPDETKIVPLPELEARQLFLEQYWQLTR